MRRFDSLLRQGASWAAACAALLAGCGGGGSPLTPVVTPHPTAQISIAPEQVTIGQTATIAWSSVNTTDCIASGSWTGSQPPSGSLTANFSDPGSYSYRIDCKGPGGTSSASTQLTVLAAPAPAGGNTMAVYLDRGPVGESFNMPYVSVTVCVPGTAACRTVDRVLLDTASVGLRVMASALDLAPSLPTVVNTAGSPVGACGHFVSGFTWGSVRRADIKLGDGIAAVVPMEVISDSSSAYATIPTECKALGFNQGTPAALGANGILGISMFARDCSTPCTTSTAPHVYFACAGGGCTNTTLPLESQVANPVLFLAGNNNGLALTFPPIPIGGTSTLAGTLTFGIGTQANNRLGAAGVYPTDSKGNFTTVYNGRTYKSAFVDSGSNAIFFNDTAIAAWGDFYAPPSAMQLSAVNTSPNGATTSVSFTVEDIRLVTNSVSAFNAAGWFGLSDGFDWGMPFFFGRTVFLAFQNAQTPVGAGPYWAY